MKKLLACFGAAMLSALLLIGCGTQENQKLVQTTKMDAVPFGEGQFYAVAYLGYQSMSSFQEYADLYLDDADVPTHYVSDGDYYLVIPKEPMHLDLYRNDIETGAQTLLFQDPSCEPFVIQCNVSDIFNDATIVFSNEEMTEEFSPFISLENGEVQLPAGAVLLTLDNAAVG